MLFKSNGAELVSIVSLLLLALLPLASTSLFDALSMTRDVAVSVNSATMLIHRRLMPRQCVWNSDMARYICDAFLPSLKEIVDRLHDTDDEGLVDSDHHMAFFTGLDVDMEETGKLITGWFASRSTDERQLQFCWFPDCIERLWMQETKRWIQKLVEENASPAFWGLDPEEAFLVCYFQALSVATLNPDVFLFTPRDQDWRADSAWEQYEYWVLTRNPNVRRIWRVDPSDVWTRRDISEDEKCHWNDPVIEWDRDAGDQELPPKQYCQIKYSTDGEPWTNWGL